MNEQIKFEGFDTQQIIELYAGEMPIENIEEVLHPDQVFHLPPSKELIQSMKDHGYWKWEPLLIEQVEHDGKFVWWIHSGTRRYQAAKIAGIENVSIHVFSGTGIEGYVFGLEANHIRSDNPLHEFFNLIEIERQANQQGIIYTDGELAKSLKITVQKLRKLRRVSVMPDPVIEAIQFGKITINNAEKITRLSQTQQSDLIEKLECGERVTEKDIKEARQVRKVQVTQELFSEIEFPTPTQGTNHQKILEVVAVRFPDRELITYDAIAQLIADIIENPGQFI